MNNKKIFIGLLVLVIVIGGIVFVRKWDKLVSINEGKSYSTTEGV